MAEFIRLEYDFHYSMSMIGHKIKIWVEDGKLHYSKSVHSEEMLRSPEKFESIEEMFGEMFIDDRISDMPAQEFAEKNAKVNIPGWDEEYEDPCVMDGWQWYVEYETAEDGVIERQGSNAKPRNWTRFRKVLAEVVGVF